MKLRTEDGGLTLERPESNKTSFINGLLVPDDVFDAVRIAMGGWLKPADPDVEMADRVVRPCEDDTSVWCLEWGDEVVLVRNWGNNPGGRRAREVVAAALKAARAEGRAAGVAEERAKHQL